MNEITPLRFLVLRAILNKNYDEGVFEELRTHAKTTPLLIRGILEEHRNSGRLYADSEYRRYSKLVKTHPHIRNMEQLTIRVDDTKELYPEVKTLMVCAFKWHGYMKIHKLLSQVQSLEEFGLNCDYLTEKDFRKTMDLKCMTSLKRLIIKSMPCEGCTDILVEHLCTFPDLARLDLEVPHTHHQVEKLVLSAPQSLQCLYISNTDWKDMIDLLDKLYRQHTMPFTEVRFYHSVDKVSLMSYIETKHNLYFKEVKWVSTWSHDAVCFSR